MGRWLNAVKKVFSPSKEHQSSQKKASKEKKKWGLGKPWHEDVAIESTAGGKKLPASIEKGLNQTKEDEEKQVLAVAATQAAAVVSRQTSTGHRNLFLSGQRSKKEWAALKIQSAFRGCLARQAYRALKGLVRLQALVRGYAVRRQAAITLRSMQALVRLQAQMLSRRRHLAANPRSRVMSIDGDRGWLERWMASAFEGEDASEASSHDQSLSGAPALRKSRFANGHPSRYDNSAKMMAMGVSKKKTPRDTTPPMPIKAIGTDTAFISPCSSQRNGDEGSAASSGRGSLVSAPPRYYNSRRHSLAGSICEDNESLTSLPAIPNYMSVTESARAKIRSNSTPKPRPTTPDKASSLSARRKLSYPCAEPPPAKAKSGPLRPFRSGSLNKSHDFMAYSGPLKFDKSARQ